MTPCFEQIDPALGGVAEYAGKSETNNKVVRQRIALLIDTDLMSLSLISLWALWIYRCDFLG